MKNIIAFLILSLNFNLFAQIRGTIPNYLLAENGNPIVIIITESHFENSFRKDLAKEIDFKNQNLDVGTYEALTKIFSDQLKTVGIKPAGFFNFDVSKPQGYYDVAMNEKIKETGSNYLITFITTDWDKQKKQYKKGNFEVKDVNIFGLGIGKFGDTNPNNGYGIGVLDRSVETCIKKLKSEIASKPATYFVKTMGENKLVDSEIDSKFKNKEYTVAESKLPSISELKEGEIIITCLLKNDSKKFLELQETIKKLYPYKFKLNSSDVSYEKGFVLTIQSYSLTDHLSKNNSTTYYYYGLLNPRNHTMYYPKEMSFLKAKASADSNNSIVKFFEYMKEFYKW